MIIGININMQGSYHPYSVLRVILQESAQYRADFAGRAWPTVLLAAMGQEQCLHGWGLLLLLGRCLRANIQELQDQFIPWR